MEEFKDKIAVVTGGAQGIGRCIADEFQKAGAHVCVIDKQAGNHFVGDISDKQVLRDVSVILWTSPTWCSIFVPTRQASSQERTSALMVA